MEVKVDPGKYILAVSGGVDSMVLLDLLAKQPDLELIIGHFNHGIRADSHKDEKLVIRRAKALKLPYRVGYGHLGVDASEAEARAARYAFLESLQTEQGAKAIITAHHQDDLIETAILNLLRGSGWRGLVSIMVNQSVLRPLLSYRKSEILAYAKDKALEWREDSTNQSEKYLRNYVRKNLITKMSEQLRQKFICNIEKVANNQKLLNNEIAKLSHNVAPISAVNRQSFGALPVDLGNELIVYWLRQIGLKEIDKQTINRLNVAIRTSKDGRAQPVKERIVIKFDRESAKFVNSL